MRHTTRTTKPRPRRLKDIAARLVIPEGIVSTGWPRVEAQARLMGIEYDDWQRQLGRLILAKDKHGVYASGIGGALMSLPRQVGKTYLIGTMIVAMCVVGERPITVLWTAHRTRTSDETFKALCGLCNRKQVRRYLAGEPRRANGQQEIAFVNGSRVMFGARETGFGRGFAGIDIEVFDEAQILTERALDDMIPATNAAPNPLILYMGTPPKPSDPSDVFASRREEAMAGNSNGMLYVEFSADEDANPSDERQWAKANPSFPHRTGCAAVLRMRKNLGEDSFRREGLGIWDKRSVVTPAIDPTLWRAGEVPARPDGGVTSFGIDMSPDRSALSIGAVARYPDGSAYVSLAEYRDPSRDGVAWAADWIASRWSRTAAVTIDAQSPAMVLEPELKARGVKVTVSNTAAMSVACGRIADMVRTGMLKHRPDSEQPQLAKAVANAITRPIGKSGGFGWQRPAADVDISPLVAVTVALHGATITRRNPNRRQHVMR